MPIAVRVSSWMALPTFLQQTKAAPPCRVHSITLKSRRKSLRRRPFPARGGQASSAYYQTPPNHSSSIHYNPKKIHRRQAPARARTCLNARMSSNPRPTGAAPPPIGRGGMRWWRRWSPSVLLSEAMRWRRAQAAPLWRNAVEGL